MNFRRYELLLAAILVAVALAGRTSYAVLIAYDGFDYPEGNLNTLNGGTGFTAGWASSGGTAQVQSPGAAYPSLDTTGNKAFISASNQNSRVLAAGDIGTGDSTIWISFIGQRVGANNIRFFGLTFYEGGTAAAQERITIGENSDNPNDQWGAHFTSAAGGRVNVAGSSINTESLLLARIDYHAGANDDFYLWVNHDLSLGEPAIGTAGAISVGAFNLAFDRISIRAGTLSGGNIGEASYDEIRIGTSYADVTPGGFTCALGDVNCDGVIDLENDFEAIRAHFRKSVAARSSGDLTGDGLVNFADFRQWKAAFLAGGGSLEGVQLDFINVPEPNTPGLVLLVGLAGAGRMRRRARNARTIS